MSALAESTEIAKVLRHVSPSSLNRFISCPENWRQRYLLGNADPAGPTALMGTADSVAFADYYRGRIAGVETELDVLEDVYRETIHGKSDEYNLEDETADTLVDKGIPTVRAYYDVATKMPDPVSVEQKILIERDSLPVPILGYLDIKFPTIIIDRKGAANKSVHPDWRLQNRIYSAAESLPAGWHITTRTKVPAVWTPDDGEQYTEPWSTARAEKTIRMCGQIMGQIESCLLMFGADNEWPTTGLSHTWRCSKCAYKKGCSAWS